MKKLLKNLFIVIGITFLLIVCFRIGTHFLYHYNHLIITETTVESGGGLTLDTSFEFVKKSEMESFVMENADKIVRFVAKDGSSIEKKYSELGIQWVIAEDTLKNMENNFAIYKHSFLVDYDTNALESNLTFLNEGANEEDVVDISKVAAYIEENIKYSHIVNLEEFETKKSQN